MSYEEISEDVRAELQARLGGVAVVAVAIEDTTEPYPERFWKGKVLMTVRMDGRAWIKILLDAPQDALSGKFLDGLADYKLSRPRR